MAFSLTKFLKGILIKEENTLNPKEVEIIPGGTSGTKTTITTSQTSDVTVTLFNSSDTVIGRETVDTLENKEIVVADNTITTAASGNLTATELNAALAELQTDIDTKASQVDFLAHETADSGVHGVTGNVVGTTDAQSLSNKQLIGPGVDVLVGTQTGTTPSTPAAGFRKLYAKADGWYMLDSTGLETKLASGGGEVNTASNVGTGSQVFKQKIGVDLQFRTLIAGSNVSLTQNADDIVINATSSGANTTLSNLTNPTNINQDLYPSNNTVIIGDVAKPWSAITTDNAKLQSNGFLTNVKASGLLSADTLLQLPPNNGTSGQVLTTDGTGITSWSTVSAGSGANTTLSNLTNPTSINQSLIPSTDGAFNIGESSTRFSVLYGNEADILYLTQRTSGVPVIHTESKSLIYGALSGGYFGTPSPGEMALRWNNGIYVPPLQGGVAQTFGLQDGVGNFRVRLKSPNTLLNDVLFQFPDSLGTNGQVLTTDGAGVTSWTTVGGSGANTALSNLITTSINQNLLPSANLTRSLGDNTLNWSELYVGGMVFNGGAARNLAGTQTYVDFVNRTLNSTTGAIFQWSNAALDILPEALPIRWTDGNSPFYTTTLQPNSTPTDNVLFRLPPNNGTTGQVLTTDGAGITSWTTVGGSGANTTLSNLTNPTAVNQDLLPSGDQVQSLGSDTKTWAALFVNAIVTDTGAGAINIQNRTLNITGQEIMAWSSAGINLRPDPGGNQRKFAIERNAVKYEITIPNITVDREFRLPINGGTSGQALTTDGTGVTSWTTVANTTLSNLTGFTDGSIPFVSGTGTTLSQDNATFFWDNTNKRLGIGVNTPNRSITIRGESASTGDGIGITNYNSTGGSNALLVLSKARGTVASPSAVLSGDTTGTISTNAHNGTNFHANSPSSISFVASENQTLTAAGSRIAFNTTGNGTTTRKTRMAVDQDGALQLYGDTSGILRIKPAATTTTHTLNMPSAQGGVAQNLQNNGSGTLSWTNRTVIESGNTGSRPATPITGETYLDLTLNKPIWYNGTNWIDATGATV